MDFPYLDFSIPQGIPSYQRYRDTPRISVSKKGFVSMNGAFRREVGAQRGFQLQVSPDGRYLGLYPRESPNIHFSAKGGSTTCLKLAKCLEEKEILLPTIYIMTWRQERQAWVGCCEELAQPPAVSAFTKGKKWNTGTRRHIKRKQRKLSPREQRLIDSFIDDICHAQHISGRNEDLHQCAWEAFLSTYRDDPSSFSSSDAQGWERAYLMICDALAEARRCNNFWYCRQTSLDQPLSSNNPVSRIQLIQAPHGDFQNAVCFRDYLHHMKKNVRQTAYHLLHGYSKDEIQAHYGWARNYTDQVFNDLGTEIRRYLAI